MRVATWNVNSIRSRVDRVVDWIVRADVDVLAMQETKCTPAQFPFEAFTAAGYQVELHGYSQWNGVAVASRLPMSDLQVGFPGMPGFGKEGDDGALPAEARAIGVTVGGTELWSLYVPNGRAIDDPHYAYKLDWLEKLALALRDRLAAEPARPLAIMGDFNIAPRDEDVWSMEFFAGRTHVTVPERNAFAQFETIGLQDVIRPLAPTGFTYWDYQQLRFPRNEGMRIDFILGSSPFADAVVAGGIEREERKGKGPSDHVPVWVDLDLGAADDEDDRPMVF
jgi:exodeoxyribonuclease III